VQCDLAKIITPVVLFLFFTDRRKQAPENMAINEMAAVLENPQCSKLTAIKSPRLARLN